MKEPLTPTLSPEGRGRFQEGTGNSRVNTWTGLERYHRPKSVRDALAIMARAPKGRAAWLAGGTRLLARPRPDALSAVIDISRLGLSFIKADRSGIRIGAATPLQDLVDHAAVGAYASGVLAEAARTYTSRQHRNRATLGGTLSSRVNEDAVTAALLVLDASLVTAGGLKAAPTRLAQYLAKSPGHALITEIFLPPQPAGVKAALARLGRTPADLPLVIAAVLILIEKGTCALARVAVAGVGITPIRCVTAERAVTGQPLTDTSILQAAAAAADAVKPAEDFRASVEYRREMARTLVRRAFLACAGERA